MQYKFKFKKHGAFSENGQIEVFLEGQLVAQASRTMDGHVHFDYDDQFENDLEAIAKKAHLMFERNGFRCVDFSHCAFGGAE